MNPAVSTLWHQVRVRPRLVAACAVAVLTFFAQPVEFTAATRALVTWDVGALLYLILAWVMMARASLDHMTRRARMEDDGAAVVLFLTVAAAAASIAAIVL